MTLRTDIGSLTISELEVIMIYGVGAAILYVFAILAIVWWELRQAKQSQAATSMLPYITKSFLYSFGWFIFVTLIWLVLISIMPGDGMSPANGIEGFWHIDWLSGETWKSLSINGNGIYTEQQLASARFMALVLMVIKLIYHIALLAFFWMIYSFTYSLTTTKTKQANEEMSYSYAGNIFLSFVASAIVFQMIIGVMSIFLTGLLELAVELGKLRTRGDIEIDILYDLTEFVRLGIEEWATRS